MSILLIMQKKCKLQSQKCICWAIGYFKVESIKLICENSLASRSSSKKLARIYININLMRSSNSKLKENRIRRRWFSIGWFFRTAGLNTPPFVGTSFRVASNFSNAVTTCNAFFSGFFCRYWFNSLSRSLVLIVFLYLRHRHAFDDAAVAPASPTALGLRRPPPIRMQARRFPFDSTFVAAVADWFVCCWQRELALLLAPFRSLI